jgi:hypothetical protein
MTTEADDECIMSDVCEPSHEAGNGDANFVVTHLADTQSVVSSSAEQCPSPAYEHLPLSPDDHQPPPNTTSENYYPQTVRPRYPRFPSPGDHQAIIITQPSGHGNVRTTAPIPINHVAWPTSTPEDYDVLSERPPRDFMWLSMLTCLCFCWPLGLMAIYYSHECQTANGLGQTRRARKHSRKAVILSVFGICIGIVAIIIVVFLSRAMTQNMIVASNTIQRRN